MKIFLICPVRDMTAQEELDMACYIAILEKEGNKVHWPPRDTDQNDSCGLRILYDNTKALIKHENTQIWWKEKSTGSKYDFGVALCLKILGEMIESGELTPEELIELLKERSIVIANPEEVGKIVEEENKKGIGKSFNKVILEIHKRNKEESKK